MKKTLIILFLLPSLLFAQSDLDAKLRPKDQYNRGLISPSEKRLGGWYIVANNPCRIGGTFGVSTPLQQSQTVRVLHTAAFTANQLRTVYVNYANIQNIAQQNPGYCAMLVGGSFQKKGTSGLTDETGFLYPLNFGGKQKNTIEPGCLLFSDPAFFPVVQGEQFFEKCYRGIFQATAPGAPTLAQATTGGNLIGGATYAVSLVYLFADGTESATSAFTSITIAAGTNTNTITVTSPTASGGAVGYRVYMTPRNPANATTSLYNDTGLLKPIGATATIQYEVSTPFNFRKQGGTLTAIAGGGIVGGTSFEGLATGESQQPDDQTLNGFRSGGQNAVYGNYWASLILGKSATPQRSAIGIGTSIMSGTGDGGYAGGNGGFFARAMGNQLGLSFNVSTPTTLGFGNLGLGGSTIANFASQLSNNQYSSSRQALMQLATTVVSDFGTNDLSDPLATIKANTLLVAKWCTNQGIQFIPCTMFPKTTSTNGWQTASNQTVTVNEATRTGYNDWLRDTISTSGFKYQANAQTVNKGLVDFIDICKYTEVNASNALTKNGGFWRVSTSPQITGTLTSVPSATQFVDTGKSLTANQYKGYNIIFTSGAAINQGGCLNWNTTNNYSITAGVTNTPAIGDTYSITLLPTIDGVHPSTQVHIWAAAAVQEKLSVFQY